jgi:hypothetical protein
MLVVGCSVNNNEESSTLDATPIPIEEPAPSPVQGPTLEPFDSTYKNLSSQNSSLVVSGNKLYFSSGRKLYYYNSSSRIKSEIANDLITSSIYILNDYVYFLTEKEFKRVNTITDDIELIFTAKELVKQRKDVRAEKNSQKFRYFFMSDNILVIYFYTDVVNDAPLFGANRFDPSFLEKYIEEDLSIRFLIDNKPSYEEEHDELKEGYRWTRMRTYFLIDSNNNRIKYDIQYAVFDSGNWKMGGKSSEGGVVLAGDKAYVTCYPWSSFSLLEYDTKTNKRTWELELDGSCATPKGLNQYVICYYFDRHKLQKYKAKEGVVLLDTKTDKIYQNEEINRVISGDIDYLNLFHTDYFLDGNTLYVLENEFSELYKDELESEEFILTKEEVEKSGLFIREYMDLPNKSEQAFIYFYDMPSKVNIYRAEIIEGKLHFTQIYKEFEREN